MQKKSRKQLKAFDECFKRYATAMKNWATDRSCNHTYWGMYDLNDGSGAVWECKRCGKHIRHIDFGDEND